MSFSSQNIKEFLVEFEQYKVMALFLGSGTDITAVYSEDKNYDKIRGHKMKWNTLLCVVNDTNGYNMFVSSAIHASAV